MQDTASTSEWIGRLIREARGRLNIDQDEAARRSGLKFRTYGSYERGEVKEPSFDKVQDIANALDIQELKAGAALAVPSETWVQDPENLFRLTIYHSVRPGAGEGTVVYQVDERDAETHLFAKQIFKDLLGFWPPDDLRGAYIRGHSMEPGLEDGQLVLYKPIREVVSGRRYVLLIQDPLTDDWKPRVKRVQIYTGGGFRLVSDNPHVEDEVLKLDDERGLVHTKTGSSVQLQIAGHVLWPREGDEAKQIHLITRTIEQLVGQGFINR